MDISYLINDLKRVKNTLKISKTFNGVLVDTGLILLGTNQVLPIFIIEKNGKFYFSDKGLTLINLDINFAHLPLDLQNFIKQKMESLDIEFDGHCISVQVNGFNIQDELTTIIAGILFIACL